MWEPLLEREIESCTSPGWWRGSGQRTVFCLLDPPRHALPAEAYRKAQESTVQVFAAVQQYRAAPLPIGLQDDFWTVAQRDLGPAFDRPLAADTAGYIQRGGTGIVAAIAAAKPRPPVLRLESEGFVAAYQRLQQEAISFMEDAAPFFGALVGAWREAEARVATPGVRELRAALEGFRSLQGGLSGSLRGIAGLARSLGVDLETPAYRPIALYEKIAELEEGLDEAATNRDKKALEDEIRARVKPQAVEPRAAVELALYELLDRHEDDEDYRETIAAFRELLAQPVLPPLPDWLPRSVAEKVEGFSGDYLVQAIRIRPEDQHRPHKGHGELVSRLLELAIVLGIDPARYARLQRFVYISNLNHSIHALSGYAAGPALLAAVEKLGETLLARRASDRERRLLEQDRMARFLAELGRFHLVYDAGLRRVVLGFDLAGFCRLLADLGARLPAGWEERAADLDRRFAAVRELYQRTLLRGKDLAGSLLAGAAQLGASAAILYCDGYLNQILAPWLQGRDISYSFLVPKW